METLERLEEEVRKLSPEEFARFKDWVIEFEWNAWDKQIECDSTAGKLDALAAKARADYSAGRTRAL